MVGCLFYALFFCEAAGALLGCKEQYAPPGQVPAGMVWIAGSDAAAGFFMDETEVTTARFADFVAATDYLTEAHDFGWSGVFSNDSLGWLPIDGANWEYPKGPDSARARPEEPVTQVSLRDVRAYLTWAGKELPSEEEWQYAASQSATFKNYPWGEEVTPRKQYLGNWWQGPFPYQDAVLDDFPGVAPVRSFPPAPNGLYEVAGNVWEWTATRDPGGQYVIKGGSFLCSTSYCAGFNLRQRQLTPADSGLNHLGFRGILRP